MKLIAFLFRMAVLIPPLMALPARADDALWAKVSADATTVKHLAATDIDMVVTAVKGSNRVGPSHYQSHLSKWVKDEPVYTMTEVDPLPATSQEKKQDVTGLMNAIVKMADGLLDPAAKAVRSDGQVLDGKTWTVFQQEDSSLGRKMVTKIWVDPGTACVYRVDVDFHVAMYVDGHFKKSYAADAQGRCLPRQMDGDFEVINPLMRVKVQLKHTFSNWVERPAAPASH